MYADRFAPRSAARPISMGAAIAINGGLIAALLLSAPELPPLEDPGVIEIYDTVDPLPPPPPPEPDKPVRDVPRSTDPKPSIADPVVDVVRIDAPFVGTVADQPPAGDALPGNGTVMVDPPVPPLPVLVGAIRDPRFARDFQPDYPAAERRAGNEGSVTVRVLIGMDGRVTAVERVDASSDAFFEATRRQALARWRFKPATRGGVPVESWQRLTVRFVLAS